MPKESSAYPDSFDPYLRAVLGGSSGLQALLNTDVSERPFFLLVTLKGLTAQQFVRKLRKVKPGGALVVVGPTQDAAPYLTLQVPAALADKNMLWTGEWHTFWNETASQVTASIPACANPGSATTVLTYDPDRPRSQRKTLLGIIDDGCGFAHARLRSGTLSSRVFALWDQECRGVIPVSASPPKVFGRKPRDFRYGLEFWRSGGTSDATPPEHEIGIDEWIAMHITPAGTVDEDWCYSHGEFESLRARSSHGMHVLDTLAGRVPTSSRVSMDRKNPPTFADGTDPACDPGLTDIVFVQIPQAGVNDASGIWLKDQVIDGLRYIMSCAGASTTRVMVNVSYGTTTGPHDGSAQLEGFFSSMVSQFDGLNGKPRLEVFLPAGNSRLSRLHVNFKSTSVGDSVNWTWRIPPDNSVPVTAEIWVDSNLAQYVSGILSAPSPLSLAQKPKIKLFQLGANTMWSIRIAPTHADPANPVPAPHGDWTIALTFAQPGVEVHGYVARTDPNMGAKPGARQSRFVDTAWEWAKGGAAGQNPDELTAHAGSLVSTAGTLSGIATGNTPHVYVAAGYRIADKRVAPYSSAGPSRGQRQGPDYALPTDETRALKGIPGAGTRSGGVFRLVGTSTAAPQLARLLLAPPPPSPPPPCPLGNNDPDMGCGPLPPP